MNYTPYATLTDEELVREVCNKEDPTDLEIELLNRLEYATEYIETLLEDAGAISRRATTDYADA